jgi:O-antigen ligase
MQMNVVASLSTYSLSTPVEKLDRATWYALVLTVLSIPFSETAKSVLYVAAVLLWLLKMAALRDFRIKVTWIGWFFLGWLAAVFLSSLGSSCGIFKGVRDVLMYTVFFFLVVNMLDSLQRVRTLLWAVLGGIALGDLYGLIHYLVLPQFVSMDPMPRLRIGSIGYTGGYLGLIMALVIGLWAFANLPNREKKWLLLVGLLSAVALVFTYRRSIWVPVVLVACLAALMAKSWRPIALGLVFMIFIGLASLFSPTIQHRLVGLASPLKDVSMQERYGIWNAAMRMVQDHPVLGIGHKCWMTEAERYGVPGIWGPARQAHNLYLNVAAETGAVGVCALLAWLSAYGRMLCRYRSRLTSDFAKGVWFAGLGTYLTFLIGSLVEPMIGSEFSLLFMLITALMVVTVEGLAQESSSGETGAAHEVCA